MGWFSKKEQDQTHVEWNDELSNKNLSDKEKQKECINNYKAVVGSNDELNIRQQEAKQKDKTINDTFNDKEKVSNTKLQQNQIEKIKDKNYNFKDKVKQDLKEVREDKKSWFGK